MCNSKYMVVINKLLGDILIGMGSGKSTKSRPEALGNRQDYWADVERIA